MARPGPTAGPGPGAVADAAAAEVEGPKARLRTASRALPPVREDQAPTQRSRVVDADRVTDLGRGPTARAKDHPKAQPGVKVNPAARMLPAMPVRVRPSGRGDGAGEGATVATPGAHPEATPRSAAELGGRSLASPLVRGGLTF